MKLRYKSATLAVKFEGDNTFQLYAVFSDAPGNGHGSELVKRALKFLSGRIVCLHVEPFDHMALTADQLVDFYGKCGFVPDDRDGCDGWMWYGRD